MRMPALIPTQSTHLHLPPHPLSLPSFHIGVRGSEGRVAGARSRHRRRQGLPLHGRTGAGLGLYHLTCLMMLYYHIYHPHGLPLHGRTGARLGLHHLID